VIERAGKLIASPDLQEWRRGRSKWQDLAIAEWPTQYKELKKAEADFICCLPA